MRGAVRLVGILLANSAGIVYRGFYARVGHKAETSSRVVFGSVQAASALYRSSLKTRWSDGRLHARQLKTATTIKNFYRLVRRSQLFSRGATRGL